MPRGGKRKGAGRPVGTGKYGEPTKALRVPVSMVDRIVAFAERKALTFPVYSGKAPADDSAPAETLDFVEYLAPNAASTFLVKVSDDAMTGAAGISPDDIVMADRSVTGDNGDIVVAVANGKLVVRRLFTTKKKIELRPDNKKAETIVFADGEEPEICGVVKSVIHHV